MAIIGKKTAELAKDFFVDVDPKDDFVTVRYAKRSKRIKKTDLYTFCMLIADPETLDKLTPVRKETVEEFTREHRVRVTKDIKEGEYLTVQCKVRVPERVVEGIKATIPA